MSYKLLETVVLNRDAPESGLRKGDLGAVVHVHGPGCYEVEFVTAAGETASLVELSDSDLRPVEGTDLVTVRSVRKSG